MVNMITGGYLPEDRRGISINGMMHIADWYATFLHLAGNTDPFDKRANKTGFPGVDSINMWDFITGKVNKSPRTQFVVGSNSSDHGYGGILYQPNNTIANSTGESIYKLIFGKQKPAFWTTLDYPNGTTGEPQTIDCGSIDNGGCFFDVVKDYTEHNNLINDKNYKDLIEEMRKKYQELEPTKINFDRGESQQQCCDQIEKNGGYWGPWKKCTDYETCTF